MYFQQSNVYLFWIITFLIKRKLYNLWLNKIKGSYKDVHFIKLKKIYLEKKISSCFVDLKNQNSYSEKMLINEKTKYFPFKTILSFFLIEMIFKLEVFKNLAIFKNIC